MGWKSEGKTWRPLAVFLLFVTGCASNHMVDVTVPRVYPNSPHAAGLTEAQARDIFRQVAGELRFHVTGPIRQPAGQEPQVQYFASLAGASGYINAYITSDAVSFYTVADNWETSKKLAVMFEQALQQRGVAYHQTKKRGQSFRGE